MAEVKTQVYDIPYKRIGLNRHSISLKDALVFYNGKFRPISDFQIATSTKKVYGVTIVDATKEILSIDDFYANINKICFKKDAPQTIIENIPGIIDLNIQVFVDGKVLPVDQLLIATKTERTKNGFKVKETRPIKSVEDIRANINSLCISKDGDIEYVKPEGFYLEDKIERFISTSINTEKEKVDEGLRRELEVVEEKKSAKGHYLCVEINGSRDFVKKSEIIWFDGGVAKTYNDLPADVDKSQIEFYDKSNRQISTIFTEKEYSFDHIIAKDDFDLENFERREFKITGDNKYSQSATKLNRVLTKQEFSTIEDKNSGRSGKTKLIHIANITNYHYNKDGEFVAVNVAGKMHIVPIKDLETLDGFEVEDLSKLVGKQVKVRENGVELGLSDPITYEQSRMTYSTVKTYQPSLGDMTDSSCVRLSNGSYINELKTVQPISYRLTAKNQVCDAYLVERIVSGQPVFEIVNKEFYEKNKNTKTFAGLNVVGVSKCDINNKNCVAVQSTSKGDSIEACEIVKGFSIPKEKEDGSIESVNVEKKMEKQDAYQAFLQTYKTGQYKISDVYIDGKNYQLDKNSGRYEYTDVSTKVVDKKFAETRKYPVGDEIASSYKKYGSFVGYSFGLAFISAGLPLIGPIVGTAYAVGVLAAAPAIPIYHSVVGFVKNVFQSKEKLSQENQHKFQHELTKDANKELKNLLKLLKSNKLSNETQFEDAFSTHVLDNIYALSKNVRTDTKGKTSSNKANKKFDPMLDKAASFKLYAYLKHFKDSEFAKTKLSFLLSCADLIGYDLKKGLTINGISIFAKTDKIEKTLKGDKEKIATWFKIKDEISQALKLMKSSRVEEPIIVDVEDKLTEAAKEEELFKNKAAEIEKLNEKAQELLNTIKSNHRERKVLEDYMLEYDSLKETISELHNSVKTKVLSSELDDVIQQMNESITKLEKAAKSQILFNETTDEIEALNKECRELLNKIENKVASLNKNKEKFMEAHEELKLKVLDSYDSTFEMSFEFYLIESKEDLLKYKKDLTELHEQVEEQIINSDKDLMINKIEEYYKDATTVVSDLTSLKYSGSMTAYTNNIAHNKTFVASLLTKAKEPGLTPKEIVSIKEKAKISLELMKIGLQSFNILEDNKEINSSKQDLAAIGQLLGVDGLSKYIRVSADMDNRTLRKNLEMARSLYETQLSVYVVEKKEKTPVNQPIEKPKAEPVAEPTEPTVKKSQGDPVATPAEIGVKTSQGDPVVAPVEKPAKPVSKPAEKAKAVKLFDVKINSEDALVALLKANPNKKERKNLIEYINKKSGVTVSEKDIQLVIDRIDEKHLMDPPKSATNNASRLANKNIYYILEYGQQYLTKYAKAIKERTIKNEDNDLGV